MKNTRFQWKTPGKALEENMVTGRNYRFTLLTSRLLRLEFDEDAYICKGRRNSAAGSL